MKTNRFVSYAVLTCVGALLWAVVQNRTNPSYATYSQFLHQVESGEVTGATIVAAHTGVSQVTYELKNGNHLQTVVPSDYRGVLEALEQKMVNIEIRDTSSQWARLLGNSAPFLLLLGFWAFLMPRLPRRDAK
jgi:ATP-dependent Zn protease